MAPQLIRPYFRAELPFGLMLVVSTGAPNIAATVSEAIAGGVDAVQLRVGLPTNTIAEIKHAAKGRATIIYNTGVQEFTSIAGINAVQVPQRLLGKLNPHCRWGASVHSPEAAQRAEGLGASWLLAGNIYATGSHPDRPARGLSWLSDICSATAVSVLAIGGIEPGNVQDCISAGAAGVAASSYILAASNPRRAAAELRAAFERCGDHGDTAVWANWKAERP